MKTWQGYLIALFFNSFLTIANATPHDALTIGLNTPPAPEHIPLVIAEMNGYFSDQKLNIILVPPQQEPSSKLSQQAASTQIEMMSAIQFLKAVDQGKPIKRVGVLIDQPTQQNASASNKAFNPPNYEEIVFVSQSTLAQDDRIPRFLEAIRKSVHFIDLHPKASYAMFIKRYPEANTKANRERWYTLLPYFSEDPAGFNATQWNKLLGYMKKEQRVRHIDNLSQYVSIQPSPLGTSA